MNTNTSSAPSASSSNKVMVKSFLGRWTQATARASALLIVGGLVACSTPPLPPEPAPAVTPEPPVVVPVPTSASSAHGARNPLPMRAQAPYLVDGPGSTAVVVDAANSAAWQWADSQALPPNVQRGNSVWQAVRWSELPGWGYDTLNLAWNAWLRSCEAPAPVLGALCPEVRQLSIATPQEQHDWVMRRLQPYRVQTPTGGTQGLLTGYYEPVLRASRQPTATFQYPLHRTPAGLRNGQPWYSRQDIATLPAAQAALQGREIAWLDDPLDLMLLHIQGSGRLQIASPQGELQTVRVAFAGTNNQPYRSINTWLAQQGAPTVPWPDAAKTWARQNPDRVGPLLWSNPRYVFFREEALSGFDAQFGPKGAQGVALTPGRSIAVDSRSIPYGTPVWLQSSGNVAQLQRLVLAQDTGSAIVGSVRADFFTGWGDEAHTLAAGLKQPLQLWVLWPRQP